MSDCYSGRLFCGLLYYLGYRRPVMLGELTEGFSGSVTIGTVTGMVERNLECIIFISLELIFTYQSKLTRTCCLDVFVQWVCELEAWCQRMWRRLKSGCCQGNAGRVYGSEIQGVFPSLQKFWRENGRTGKDISGGQYLVLLLDMRFCPAWAQVRAGCILGVTMPDQSSAVTKQPQIKIDHSCGN